jgi:hypothetical protein
MSLWKKAGCRPWKPDTREWLGLWRGGDELPQRRHQLDLVNLLRSILVESAVQLPCPPHALLVPGRYTIRLGLLTRTSLMDTGR